MSIGEYAFIALVVFLSVVFIQLMAPLFSVVMNPINEAVEEILSWFRDC